MSKSLKALERISGESRYYRLYGNDYDTIKQDLEELIILKDKITELEKENEELSNDIKLNEAQIDDLTLEVANYKHALEEKNEIIMDLKEENQELIEQLKLSNESQETVINTMNLVSQENEKYKKAIEIIKNKCVSNTNLWLVVCSRNYEDYKSFVENKDHELVRIEHNILTQQEYELLKEVLGNE